MLQTKEKKGKRLNRHKAAKRIWHAKRKVAMPSKKCGTYLMCIIRCTGTSLGQRTTPQNLLVPLQVGNMSHQQKKGKRKKIRNASIRMVFLGGLKGLCIKIK